VVTATIVARSVHGIEWIAADEIATGLPGAGDLALARREITFTVPEVDERLLGLRTVDDVFLSVGRVTDVGSTKAALAPLAAQVTGLDWGTALAAVRALRALPRLPRFDVVASIEGRRSFNRYAVENTVGAALAPVLSAAHLARTNEGRPAGEPDLTVRVFLRGEEAGLALRLGDAPLHRRAYKLDTGPGTLHPPLAAALVRLAAPAGLLLDPCCGDGTIPIEAALANPEFPAIGADLDPARLAGARRNADRAGVNIQLVRADAGAPPWRPHQVDALVSNPPWGLAVDPAGRLAGSLRDFWRSVPELLDTTGRGYLIVDDETDRPAVDLAALLRVRLAGRVSQVLACTPPGQPAPALSAGLARWRRRAIAAGVVTEDGF